MLWHLLHSNCFNAGQCRAMATMDASVMSQLLMLIEITNGQCSTMATMVASVMLQLLMLTDINNGKCCAMATRDASVNV